MESVSIPSYFVSAIIKNLPEDSGIRLNLLQKNAIPVNLPGNRDARLSANQFWRLQQDVTNFLQDEMLGYLQRPIPPGSFKIACHSLINCATLGDAMARYCHFYQIIDRGVVPELRIDGNYARLATRPADRRQHFDNYVFEASLYYAHRLINWLGNDLIPPVRVNLAYEKPDHAAVYRPLFFGAPVNFDREASELVFDAAVLNLPNLQTHQTLSRFLRKATYRMLIQYYESTIWSGKVKKFLSERLQEMPSLEHVARQLALHPQTLRRRLQTEGTSYQKLKNHARRDYAIYRLGRSNETIGQIAESTGYSEASTFIRAFKGWTGMTPMNYRNIG